MLKLAHPVPWVQCFPNLSLSEQLAHFWDARVLLSTQFSQQNRDFLGTVTEYCFESYKKHSEISLVDQGLRLHTSTAGGMDLILEGELRFLAQHSCKKKKKKKKNSVMWRLWVRPLFNPQFPTRFLSLRSLL